MTSSWATVVHGCTGGRSGAWSRSWATSGASPSTADGTARPSLPAPGAERRGRHEQPAGADEPAGQHVRDEVDPERDPGQPDHDDHGHARRHRDAPTPGRDDREQHEQHHAHPDGRGERVPARERRPTGRGHGHVDDRPQPVHQLLEQRAQHGRAQPGDGDVDREPVAAPDEQRDRQRREDDPRRDRRAGRREHLEHGDEPGARCDDRVQAARDVLVDAHHRTGGDLHHQREQPGRRRRPPRTRARCAGRSRRFRLRGASSPDRAPVDRAAPGGAGLDGTGRLRYGDGAPRTGAPDGAFPFWRRCYPASPIGPAGIHGPARLGTAEGPGSTDGRSVRRTVHEHGVSARHAVSAARRVDPPGRLSRGNQGFLAARDRLT